ncbi:MAG TPA: hypothetical protein VNJ12_14120 [Candidatus Dormibacteraeota bacterium]|nr:hypothetical protein [Candidatus Dormibacteraeota bacterium]
MGDTTALRAEWVRRVLGVSLQGTSPTSAANPVVQAAALWREAKEKVDIGISALARTMRGTPQPAFHRVADEGLFGLTSGGLTVPLTAAIFDFDAAVGPARATAAQALKKQIAAYRSGLGASQIARLVDENPFGIEVGLRKTVLDALATIERDLTERP